MTIGITPYFNLEKKEEYMPEGYIRSVELIGAEMRVIHYDTEERALKELADTLDGVIFSGGDDVDPSCYGRKKLPVCGPVVPERDLTELRLFSFARRRGLPILGICRGIQLINVAMGGTLIQDIPSAFPGVSHVQAAERHALWHDVILLPDTPVRSLFDGSNRLKTNSFHHQAIDRLGSGLTVSAVAEEGFPEAVYAAEGPFLWAVQWHPEVSLRTDKASEKLIRAFGSAVNDFYAGRHCDTAVSAEKACSVKSGKETDQGADI